MTDPTSAPIAVVGVSALFPGSVDRVGFWRDILAGRDLVSDVPPTHWLIEDYYDADPSAPDKTYARRGAFLPDVDFDALAWGVPPSIVPATDTSQLLALIVAQRVLDDATRGRFAEMDKDRISVILGVTSAQEPLGSMVSRLQKPIWQKSLRDAGLPEAKVQEACQRIADHYSPWQESTFPGLLGNVVAGRIANRLDLGGTNCVTDAACASAFSAVSMAVNELRLGQSDLVVTGGVDTMNDIFMYMCFSKTPALSRTGDCRPFSDRADGTLLGEGLGMVALKRLEEAERDGDRIYAVLRGVGSSSDGRSKSVYAPLPAGQAKALRRAYADAGYGAETVELVEAHGTGTKAGDAAEFEGLCIAFGEAGADTPQWCALGSVKSQIGHTKAAAGAAGLFKVVMALQHGVLPPTIKIDAPNPRMSLSDSPFYLNTVARPWVRAADHPRRAGVSSFGFGGSNFHLALEQYTGPHAAGRLRTAASELVLLSADTPEALARDCRAVEAGPEGFLPWFAWQSLQRFDAKKPHRLALLAKDEAELVTKLGLAADRIASEPAKSFALPGGLRYGAAEEPGGVAFLFPGQGAQYVGMGDQLAMQVPAALAAWDLAAGVDTGEGPVQAVVFPRPVFTDAERDAQATLLTATRWAQPAIGASSLAVLEVLRALGVTPVATGGHSFGEVMALHAAGVLGAEDALRVARRRGELMEEAAKIPGAMSAVRADADAVRAAVEGTDVVLSNLNSPKQTLISGSVEAIEAAEARLKAAGLRARRAQVATAFHSPIVAPAAEPFADFLADVAVHPPQVAVYANATAAPYTVESVRELLARQIASPVRYIEQIEAMYAAGVRTFVEVGPGAIQSGLVGQILGDRPHRAIATDRKGADSMVALQDAVGALAVAGVSLDAAALWAGYAEPDDPRAATKPRLALPINGANYGKPYPPPEGAAGLPAPNPEPVPPEPEVIVKEVVKEVIKEVKVEVPVASPGASTAPQSAHSAHAPALAPALAPAFAPALAPAEQQGWLAAFQQLQQQTAQAHTSYQQAMAQTHTAFLQAVEASFAGLTAIVTGQAPAPRAPAPQPRYALPAPAPTLAAPAPQTVAPQVPVAAEPPAPTFRVPTEVRAPAAEAPTPPVIRTVEVPTTPTPSASPTIEPPKAAPSLDLEALLMDVVAEKTGYPPEMLALEMGLESDLGIDSIKRVEILSAMRERAPELPEVDAGEMATLRTLGQIVDYMRAQLGPSAPSAQAAAPAAPALDLEALLMDVVAEKTGYPPEMLALEMGLESDLGIDSIKRVEILSAMRERAPELPEVDAGEMATLRTLGQIVDYMRAQLGPSAAPTAAAPTATPSLDLEALLMDVVAEKTGYPPEMLALEMGLESDLGIDSIKRVEILSAMRERAPELPEVDAGEMATLRTLGQIVDYMRAQLGGGPEPEPPGDRAAVPEAPASDDAPEVGRFALERADAPVGFSMRGLADATAVFIVDDGGGVASTLAGKLRARGLPVTVGESPTADTDALIDLRGLTTPASVDAALGLQRAAFQAARVVAPRMEALGGVYVLVQDTGGDFGATGTNAWLGGLAGLAKTAALEWPEASVKALDLERGGPGQPGRSAEALAQALYSELFAGGPEPEVGLKADGRRLGLVSVRAPLSGGGGVTLAPGAVVVASGGARGVTARCLIELARRTRARLGAARPHPLADEPEAVRGVEGDANLKRALLGHATATGQKLTPAELGRQVRRILSQREVRETLDAVRAAGGEARYVAVDVTDADGVTRALDAVRAEWGPVAGIVHGAGVIADKKIAEKADDAFDFVVSTKLGGLRALLSAAASDPLRFVALFSSVAGRSGNQGQCDYAMANETLNKVGAQLAQGGAFVKSFGWGPWEGGMVTPALKARFEALGVPLIPLGQGARMFADELLAGPAAQVELVIGGPPRHAALLSRPDAPAEATFELVIDASSHPYLAHHSIQGVPVVPVVMVLEWFSRAARACRPDLSLLACRKVRVLKGVRLAHFHEGGDRLWVHARQLSNGGGVVLALELRGEGGVLHYSATAELGAGPAAPGLTTGPALELAPWGGAIYGDALFHGPDFQVIRSVDGVSDEGIRGTLVGTAEVGWKAEPWTTDPAALDGGLQMALLWSQRVLGGRSLPTAVGSYQGFTRELPTGPISAELRGRKVSGTKAVSDIRFTGDDGRIVAELRDVETHLLP